MTQRRSNIETVIPMNGSIPGSIGLLEDGVRLNGAMLDNSNDNNVTSPGQMHDPRRTSIMGITR